MQTTPSPNLRCNSNSRPDQGSTLLGLVLGFAIALPFVLLSIDTLAVASSTALGAIVATLLIVGVVTVVALVNRRRIFPALRNTTQETADGITTSLLDAVSAWPTNRSAATASATTAARSAVSLLAWTVGRRVAIAAIVGLAATVVAMLGTILIVEQNRKLEAQTNLLENQNVVLERQTEIMANQGLWEKLWEANFGKDVQEQVEAAEFLTSQGHMLNGLRIAISDPAPLGIDTVFNGPNLSAWSNRPASPWSLSPDTLRMIRRASLVGIDILPSAPDRGAASSSIHNLEVELARIVVGDEYFVEGTFRDCLIKIGRAIVPPAETQGGLTASALDSCQISGSIVVANYLSLENCDLDDVLLSFPRRSPIGLHSPAQASGPPGRMRVLSCKAGRLFLDASSLSRIQVVDSTIEELVLRVPSQIVLGEVLKSLDQALTLNTDIGQLTVARDSSNAKTADSDEAQATEWVAARN